MLTSCWPSDCKLPQAGYRLIDTFYILHVNFWYLLAVTAPPPDLKQCTLCQGLGASVHLPGLHRCIASTSKVQGGINFPLSHRSINLQVNKMGNIPILNFYNACIFLFYVFHDPPNADWEWFVCVNGKVKCMCINAICMGVKLKNLLYFAICMNEYIIGLLAGLLLVH